MLLANNVTRQTGNSGKRRRTARLAIRAMSRIWAAWGRIVSRVTTLMTGNKSTLTIQRLNFCCRENIASKNARPAMLTSDIKTCRRNVSIATAMMIRMRARLARLATTAITLIRGWIRGLIIAGKPALHCPGNMRRLTARPVTRRRFSSQSLSGHA